MITLAMIAMLLMPPKQFDHYPTRNFITYTIPANLEETLCGRGLESTRTALACVFEGSKIYIRDDLTPAARAKVLKHEYGHINGWKHGVNE